MPQRPLYTSVRRGRLSEDEIAEIYRLGSRKWGAGRIALKLNRHPATVHWWLYRFGHAQPVRRTKAYVRGGVMVTPFSEAEDALLLQLRRDGLKCRAIAARLSEAFGRRRKTHSVEVRLVMLAGADECAECAA
jgi:hypothetical protein